MPDLKAYRCGESTWCFERYDRPRQRDIEAEEEL